MRVYTSIKKFDMFDDCMILVCHVLSDDDANPKCSLWRWGYGKSSWYCQRNTTNTWCSFSVMLCYGLWCWMLWCDLLLPEGCCCLLSLSANTGDNCNNITMCSWLHIRMLGVSYIIHISKDATNTRRMEYNRYAGHVDHNNETHSNSNAMVDDRSNKCSD